MHSLRTRLLLLLFGAVLLTACVQAFIAYRTSLDETNEIFDYQMEQMALSLRPGLPVGGFPSNGFRDDRDESFEFIVQVSTLQGKKIFQSTPSTELPRVATSGRSTFDARGTTYKLFSLLSGDQLIQVAQDREARRNLARTLALRTVSPIFVMVALLLLLVWWVVSASLAPVERVRRQVASRQADELKEVSEDGLPAEIFPLVHELNLLFHRVRHAFEAQKNFIADAAHELRSPLAALKLQVDGLRRASDEATREVAVHRLTAGIDRATRLVEQLLMLARQQAAPTDMGMKKTVYLAKMMQSIVGDLWESANARQIDIGLIDADDSVIFGHQDALNILVRNLLDNAIKYTPVGGTVNVAVRVVNGHTELTVEDSGPGIPPEDRERVFDRFYRVAGAQSSGSGLGLAIVKTMLGKLNTAPSRTPRRRPALRDGLALGVEAHRVRPVGVQVAEQRALPAAERVVGHRHRQRHVDAHHADLDVVAEVARRLAVAGEDAGAVAVFVRVDQLHGFLQRLDAHDAEHRAEDLFLVDRHAGLDVVEQAGAQEVAVSWPGTLTPRPSTSSLAPSLTPWST
jgi:two-component system OmpR family sensor kinase